MLRARSLFVIVVAISCLSLTAADSPVVKKSMTIIAIVPQPARGNPQTDPQKPLKRWCKRCLKSHFDCTEKDKNGDCIHWKFVCDEWETYPCD